MRAIIIDDEADGRETIEMVVRKHCPWVELCGSFGIPEEALEAVQILRPNLVFLDVHMPVMSGFDLLEKVGEPSFEVIFVTAHDQYAIRAIKFSAIDYLLKPIVAEELIQAVRRAGDRMDQQGRIYRFQSVVHNLDHTLRKIAVPTLQGIDFFEADEIIHCQSEGSYTRLFLVRNRSELVSRNLKEFEDLLSSAGFFRVHHSHLVNLRHIQRYVRGEGGYVVLSEGHHAAVSRRKKDQFLSILNRV